LPPAPPSPSTVPASTARRWPPCTRNGNDIAITVPASLVGNPAQASLFEAVTAFTALDSGQPLFVGPGTGNMPTITDATPAYDATLGVSTLAQAGGGGNGSGSQPPATGATPLAVPNTSATATSAPAAAALAVLAMGGALWWGRRRRRAS
jgi:LPXTG-motif cell wall-anchored protein